MGNMDCEQFKWQLATNSKKNDQTSSLYLDLLYFNDSLWLIWIVNNSSGWWPQIAKRMIRQAA
jgi:hypothetical protein